VNRVRKRATAQFDQYIERSGEYVLLHRSRSAALEMHSLAVVNFCLLVAAMRYGEAILCR